MQKVYDDTVRCGSGYMGQRGLMGWSKLDVNLLVILGWKLDGLVTVGHNGKLGGTAEYLHQYHSVVCLCYAVYITVLFAL